MSSKSLFSFPDIDSENETLAVLRPLVIPGMVDPIEDGDGGINLKVVEDSDAGMLCAIHAYWKMLEGDKHVIYWDKKPVFTKVVEADEVDLDFLFFYLPVAIAQPGWAEECHYQLTRFGGTTPDDPAVPQRLLVKLTRPGGRDDRPNDPDGHGKLLPVTLPPEVVQQGIDAEWAKKGVPVTVPFYPEMAVRDTVLVKWGSTVLAPHTVTQDEVDHKTPIVIIADQAAILAGGDNDALVLRYDIHDEVWNWAVRHSQSTRVRVEAGAWRLEAPIIKEAINGVITIKDLNKQDVTVQVRVTSADFDLDDTVTLSWIGTPLNGKPLVHTETRPVVSIPSILELKVPYAQIRAIAMGLGDASYVLTKKNGTPPQSSKRAFANVEGDVSMLPEPSIRELFGDTLEPDEALATVDVRYPGIANGDLINLIWAGTRAGGQPYLHEAQHAVSDNEATRGLVTLYVDNEHIRVLDQGRLDLSYHVSNDKVSLYGVSESERLLVNVATLHATLPVPKVEEADPPDVLDPSGVVDSVHVLIDQARTLRKDILTYYWRAPDPLGSTSDWVPITTVTEGKPVRFRVDAQFVTGNIGEYVKVRYALWRAATQKYEYSATLDLLIGEVVGPTIISVTDPKGVEIPDKGVTVETRVTLSGTASKGLKVRVLDNDTPVGEPTADLTTGIWTLPVNGLSVAVHRFKARALYGSGVESDIRELQVLAQVTPSIDNVTDSKGPVVQGGITFDRSVTVTGKASPNQKVRLRDGTTTLHEPTANASGIWTQVVSGLTVKAYSLTALALYGDGPVSTPARTFTVAQAVTPTIDNVTDSKGPVVQGGTTFDHSVTVTGKASPNQKVRLRDGTTTLHEPTANASGIWTQVVSGLTVKAYSLTALALYGDGPVSTPPRTFNVAQAGAPSIDNVTDSKGPVVQGGITFDRSVTVTGKASPNQKVRLLDGTNTLHEPTANASGVWTQVVSGLTVKAYSLTALALYGDGQVSTPARTFSVAQAVTPTIDNVTDSKGPVVQGGTTFDHSVTVTGKASPNQKVRLRDGTTTLHEPTANASGIWTQVVSGLTVKAYSLTALALYGDGPVSTPPRTFNVAQAGAPSIDNVTDSKGPVVQGGITFDRSVTVTGKASPNQKVRLLDGTNTLHEPTANASGVWTQVVSGLTVKAYSLTALALYGDGPVSTPPRTFNVAQAGAPSIDNVTDSKGPVMQGGITFDRSVTVTGKASPNQKVRLLDGTNTLHEPTANASGVWTQVVSGLTVKAYSLTALALYGDGQVSTPARTFSVAQAVTPTIDNVTDSKGPVVQGGITFDRSVTVTGKASPNQKVRLLDGTNTLHEPTANASGVWTQVVSGLTVKAYSLTALALYGDGPVSTPARTFTVAQAVTPTIDNVTDSKGPVVQGGTTFDHSVTVTGKASPNQKVRLRDGTTTLHEPTANASGVWTQVVSGLTVKAYSLTALALYGDGPVSTPARTFNVAQAGAPSIDNVTDSKGPVVQGGITFDRSVTVTGKASPNQKVRLRDGTTTLHEPTANGSGVWTQVVSGLTVKAYSLTALALYGDGPVSTPARTFNVAQAVTPTIDNVTDSKGPVVQGGTTFDRSVTVTGKASPNQKVRLRDGANTLHEPTANASGIWTQVVSGLTVKAYSLTALALYGDGPVSTPARTFTVAQAVTPTIDNVTDSKGPVVQGGTTFDRSVTVTGKASPNQKVRLRDGANTLHEPTANASGIWTQVVSGLTVKAYSLTALALYGDGPVSTPARTFTVAQAVTPTISNVTDSKGPVANGGITVDRTVTVTGMASPNQKVRLLDGSTTLHEPTANASGVWTQVVTGLSVATHSFKAKALYGSGAESAVRTLIVTEATAPTLTSVKGSPSDKEIPNNGTTEENTVILSGIAAKGQKVRVFDGTTHKGDATVDATTGAWKLTVSGLSIDAHSFKAKALYTTEAESQTRNFRVLSAFLLDETTLTLAGLTLKLIDCPFPVDRWNSYSGLPADTGNIRSIKGGYPPYTLESRNTEVASIEINSNAPHDIITRSIGNGTTTIKITDAYNRSRTFSVTVKNVQKVIFSSQPMDLADAINWKNRLGGRLLKESNYMDILQRTYRPADPKDTLVYACEPEGEGMRVFLRRWTLERYANMGPYYAACVVNW